MNLQLKDLLYIAGIVILAYFLFDQCQRKKDFKADVEKISTYKDSISYYKSKSGDLIASNKALEISQESLEKSNDSIRRAFDNLKMKKVDHLVEVRIKTVIDTFTKVIHDSIPCNEDFTYNMDIDSSLFDMSVSILNKDQELSFRMNSLSIENKQSIVTGIKRNGLFKRNEYTVTVQNSNPLVRSTGLKDYTFKEKKKWYERGLFKFTAGVLIGGAGVIYLSR